MENNDFDNIPEKFQEIPDPFAPQPQATYNSPPPKSEPEMSVGNWILTLFLTLIPCVGFIMLIVWAASDGNKTRSNYAKAALILWAITTVISIVIWVAAAGAMFGALGAMGGW